MRRCLSCSTEPGPPERDGEPLPAACLRAAVRSTAGFCACPSAHRITCAAALAGRYGPADLVTDKGELRHLIWRDEPRRTRIHFRDTGGDCTIDYRELRGPLDR